MPIDPNIYSQIQQPNMLQTITSGLQAGNALSDMSYQRTQREREEAAYPQKLADEKAARLFARQTQIGGVLTKLQQSIAMGNVSDDAIKQQAMQAKQYGLPDDIIQQTFGSYLQTPAEKRAEMAQGHVTNYDEWFKGETTRRGQDITAETSRLNNAASNAARNAPKLSSDLLIPGADGQLVPNSALIDARTKIAQAGASQNVNMGAPQIAINPKTGKPEYVQFGNRPGASPMFSGVTPVDKPANSADGKPMTQWQETQYRNKLADDYKAAGALINTVDDVKNAGAELKGHKGLPGISGIQGYLPSNPYGDAAGAQVKLDNLKGKVTSMGKAIMAASGALGPMAIQEWKIVSDAVAALDPKTADAKSIQDQIDIVSETADRMSVLARDSYIKQYGDDFERYPQFRELPKSRLGGNSGTNPIKEEVWVRNAQGKLVKQ